MELAKGSRWLSTLVIGGVLGCLSGSERVEASPFLTPWQSHSASKGQWRVSPELSYFKSSSNFNDQGQESIPTAFLSYTRIGLKVPIQYGIHERITPFAHLNWSSVSLETTARTANSFGFGDQTLGLNARVLEWGSEGAISLQAQFDFPAYDNTSARRDGTPFPGDGTINATGGGFLSLPISSRKTDLLLAELGAGYTWRSKSFSAAFPWSARFSYSARKIGWLASVQGYGMLSGENDAAIRTGVVPGGGTGGNFMSEARNPTFIAISASGGYRLSAMTDFFGKFSSIISGKNAPKGWSIALGAEFRLGREDDSDPLDRQTPEQYGKSNRGFVDYTLQARVTSVNDRLHLLKINKGSEAGLKMGHVLDVFKPAADDTAGEAVARGKVTDLKTGEAVVKITEYFREVWIQEGFIVQKPIE